MDTMSPEQIRTRFIIISDTHGHPLKSPLTKAADVVIHCGDLTEHSKLDELRTTIQLLKDTPAPLKLVIAGNHDFTLDESAFEKKLAEADRIAGEPIDRSLVKDQFGHPGEAQRLLEEAAEDGIVFLHEGRYSFSLQNGARLKVYASPYTPSNDGYWGFQYRGEHSFDIEPGTSVVMTHGPPHGILDRTEDRKRIGCPGLFEAVARKKPLVHCFGHVHHGWGAKLVSWRKRMTEKPSHFTDVDNEASIVIDSLASLGDERAEREFRQTSHCSGDEYPVGDGKTLFINASIMGDEGQMPWVVDIELPSV